MVEVTESQGAKRRAPRIAAVLLAIVWTIGAYPLAAAACDTRADYGRGWSDNCAIGYGYDTAANYITGTQRILKGLGYYGGSIDGLWGPLSDGATRNYQAAHGLTADGIVGSNTWFELDGEIARCFYGSPYWYYMAPGESCAASSVSFRLSTNTWYWYIRKLNGGWQAAFDLYGPN